MIYIGIDTDRDEQSIPCVDLSTAIEVNYFNQKIPVEPWAHYIATDADGKVYCFNHCPGKFMKLGKWCDSEGYGLIARYCGEMDLEGLDWFLTRHKIGWSAYTGEKRNDYRK